MSGKEVQKWADKAMFKAEEIDASAGPQVKLLSCNPDPLGTIAAAALMYEGKSVASLAEISDEQRRHYLEQVQKSVLEAPLEFVNFHFIISGVTRGFTHQMVRQRTATYTQESTRFAVKETVPVALPPSLLGTMSWDEYEDEMFAKHKIPIGDLIWYKQHATREQKWRARWDRVCRVVEEEYNALVAEGMPAEDARGLLPTNLLTRINYNTSMRGLKDHAGVRLCTQAQFEWRQVWAQIIPAIREYGRTAYYQTLDGVQSPMLVPHGGTRSSAWQFEALADVFKPICYYKGRCQFMSDVDRHCSIRGRVEGFANLGIPSTEWHRDVDTESGSGREGVRGIEPGEWMLEGTARISQ